MNLGRHQHSDHSSQSRKGEGMMEAEVGWSDVLGRWRVGLWAKECGQAPGARKVKEMDSHPEPQERAQP